MIVFQSITKRYTKGALPALDGVSLEVHAKQFCVVLGPSGSGKSTLLRTVNGLVRPTSGRVLVGGTPVLPKTTKKVRRRVGMIHQQFNLVPRLSVLDNVVAGALPTIPLWRVVARQWSASLERRACELLESVNLKPAYLQRRVSELSGGEQQRVAIARAFIAGPDVVLADEPVASLDPSTSRTVLALLRAAAEQTGATVLCSLHQVDLAREFSDRIVAMRAGEVVFDGAPDRLERDTVSTIYFDRGHASGAEPGPETKPATGATPAPDTAQAQRMAAAR
ncbi:MAG: phosphonate ABC transporter ATP-binding protein [Phycisphaerales bacterium]|nr:phosphonate ABC transporter ATP-binding protein [Phycisphaerales bacterium]